MSRRKKALERQKKQSSAERRAKEAKKKYYNSNEAREKWNDKKARKQQSQVNLRVSKGVSVDCPLNSWEEPNAERCKDCELKCSFKFSIK